MRNVSWTTRGVGLKAPDWRSHDGREKPHLHLAHQFDERARRSGGGAVEFLQEAAATHDVDDRREVLQEKRLCVFAELMLRVGRRIGTRWRHQMRIARTLPAGGPMPLLVPPVKYL